MTTDTKTKLTKTAIYVISLTVAALAAIDREVLATINILVLLFFLWRSETGAQAAQSPEEQPVEAPTK